MARSSRASPFGPTFAREDLGVLLLMGGGFFVVLFGSTLGQNVALAILLERLGAESLPKMYVANAVALAAVSFLTTRLLRRLPLRAVLVATFLVGAGAAWAMSEAHARGLGWAPGGLYVAAFALTDLAVVLFWSVANRVYDTREAKRLFPLLGAAGTAGAASSGFFARAVVESVGTAALLDMWVVLLVACAGWGLVAAGRSGEPGPSPRGTGSGCAEPREAAADRPLWWSILAGLVFVVMATLFGRYLYGLALKEAYPDAEGLAAVNGLLIGLSSLLTLGVQLFLVSRLLARFGVGLLGLVYPAVMLCCFGALRASFGLPAAVACFFGITTVRQGVQAVAESVLYTPLPPRAAARALVFMAAAGMPAGMALAGAGLEMLGGSPPEAAALAGLALAGALLVAGLARARAYRGALRRRLLRGGSDVRVRFGAILDESNATVESILAEGLSPDDPDLLERLRTLVRAHQREEVERAPASRGRWDEAGPLGRVVEARLRESYALHSALERLPDVPGFDAVPAEVTDLLRGAVRQRLSENVAVVLAALRAGTHLADFDRIHLRVFDADRRVRAAAVEILDSVCPEGVRSLVLPLLEEKRLREGAAAARRRYGEAPTGDPVEELLSLPDDWVRACTAYASAHLDPSPYAPILRAHRGSRDRFLAFAAEYALAAV
jgi:hypothetical protein